MSEKQRLSKLKQKVGQLPKGDPVDMTPWPQPMRSRQVEQRNREKKYPTISVSIPHELYSKLLILGADPVRPHRFRPKWLSKVVTTALWSYYYQYIKSTEFQEDLVSHIREQQQLSRTPTKSGAKSQRDKKEPLPSLDDI